MEENLQSRTFNKTSKPFNNFVNEIRNPYANNISTDLSYKRRAIHETRRNPEHVGNGPDYLFAKRVGIIRRNYQFGKITRAQYENEYRKIYIARWGCPPPMKPAQRYQVQSSAHDVKDMHDRDGDDDGERREADNQLDHEAALVSEMRPDYAKCRCHGSASHYCKKGNRKNSERKFPVFLSHKRLC